MRNYFETRLVFDPGRTSVWRAITEYVQRDIGHPETVVDLGAGYCDFINQVAAKRRIALDSLRDPRRFCSQGVHFVQACANSLPLRPASVDAVFASNLLEHLEADVLDILFQQLKVVLKEHGCLVLLQPNYRHCYREYWDDYTHVRAFSHISLCDYLVSRDFDVVKVTPRFLPLSFRSRVPKSYWITKAYLALPIRPFAKQMYVVARPRRGVA